MMKSWRVSCPVNNMAELKIALEHFEYVDIATYYFKLSLDLGERGSPERIIDVLMPYKDKISGMHMLNNYMLLGNDGIPLFKQDIKMMSALGIEIGAFHLRPPVDIEDLEQQLQLLRPIVSGTEIKIAIENLPDSRNNAKGFNWIREPAKIAEYLETNYSANFGLCLDTSHAICRGITRWNTQTIRNQVVAMHFSDSRVGKDEHLPIGPDTKTSILEEIAAIIESCDNDGVIILEQMNLEDSLSSIEFLRRSTAAWTKCFRL